MHFEVLRLAPVSEISPVNAPVFASLTRHRKRSQAWKHGAVPFFRELSHLLMQGGKKKQQQPVGSNG